MYQISGEDREFAVQYYYEKLIMNKGISHDEYIRTLRPFFLKEYSEWICYARENHDTAIRNIRNIMKNSGFLQKDWDLQESLPGRENDSHLFYTSCGAEL